MSSVLEQAHRTTRKIYGDREFGQYIWNPLLQEVQRKKLLSKSIPEVAPILAKLLNKKPKTHGESSLVATTALISQLLNSQPFAITSSQKLHAFLLSNDRTVADRINNINWLKIAPFIKPTVPKPGREYMEDHFWDQVGIERIRYIDISPDAVKKREERKKRRQEYFAWFTALVNGGFAWAIIQQQAAGCRWALTKTEKGLIFAQYEQTIRSFTPILEQLRFMENGILTDSSVNQLVGNNR